MKSKVITTLLVLILLQASTEVYSQYNYYQASQVGAKSSLLGGAVTGFARDNSAIYYNPSGLAFIDNASMSVMGDTYGVEYLFSSNGAGETHNLRSLSADAHPQIISGILKSKKNPILTVNYAIINKDVSRTFLTKKNSGVYDVIESKPGLENYHSVIENFNESREVWAGAGWGYKINDRLGIGFSAFVTVKTQTHREKFDVSIVDYNVNEDYASFIAGISDYASLDYLNVGLLGKLGISYEFEKLKIGANFTFPKLPVYTTSTYNRSEQLTLYEDSISLKRAFYQDDMENEYKTPLSIDIGIKYIINKKYSIYLSSTFYAKIDKYKLLEPRPPENNVDELLAPADENFNTLYAANKALVNVNAGAEHYLNESITVLAGFHTDFNYIDYDAFEINEDYMAPLYRFNVYHVSGGVEWNKERLSLIIGIRTSIGNSYDQKQVYNLNSPTEDNLFVGDLNNNVNTNYFKGTLLFGFTYLFPRE